MEKETEVGYKFRTLNQSYRYTLTTNDVTVAYRHGIKSTSHTLPLDVLRGHRSEWQTTNTAWIGLFVVSLLAIGFGIWGFIDPDSTGMSTVVAVALVIIGAIAPWWLRDHRALTGVTFSGDNGYTISVVAHINPSADFQSFVNALESRTQQTKPDVSPD